jgi:hypothetical protein
VAYRRVASRHHAEPLELDTPDDGVAPRVAKARHVTTKAARSPANTQVSPTSAVATSPLPAAVRRQLAREVLSELHRINKTERFRAGKLNR